MQYILCQTKDFSPRRTFLKGLFIIFLRCSDWEKENRIFVILLNNLEPRKTDSFRGIFPPRGTYFCVYETEWDGQPGGGLAVIHILYPSTEIRIAISEMISLAYSSHRFYWYNVRLGRTDGLTDGWLLNIYRRTRVENEYWSPRKYFCYSWWLLNFCRFLDSYVISATFNHNSCGVTVKRKLNFRTETA
jgi:hypothetical protein